MNIIFRIGQFIGRKSRKIDKTGEKSAAHLLQIIPAAVDKTEDADVLVLDTPFGADSKDQLVYVKLMDRKGNMLSENFYQYWKDSELEYEKPNLTVEKLDEYSFAITTDTYTKNIFIEAHDNEAVLSDNYFHLLKGPRKVVTATAKLDFDKMEIMTLNEIEK